jgi:ATP/maltotriose-dependent transcriptional regulator MalT
MEQELLVEYGLPDTYPTLYPDRSAYGLPKIYLPRRRLWTHLDAATEDAGLTLLAGPNGSGKTLGVRGWLAMTKRHQIDRGEIAWANADARLRPERLAPILDTTGGSDGRRRLVVVDSAELLPAQTLRMIQLRLDRSPDSMRLLLITRRDLPIDHLAAESLGQFIRLPGTLLRLEPAESAELIARHARTSDPDVIGPIQEAADGWAAAVVVAARVAGAAPDPAAVARRMRHDKRTLADQVAGEVMSTLSGRTRHLLLCVAGEEYLSRELAAHLSGDAEAGMLLDDLVDTGMLVTPLDDAIPMSNAPDWVGPPGQVFRIHPLLAEVARRRLLRPDVEVRAAREAVMNAVALDLGAGSLDRALERAIAVGAMDAAADIVSRHGLELVARGSGAAVLEFARRNPDVVLCTPTVWFPFMVERWIFGDIEQAVRWLKQLRQRSGRDVDPAENACVRLLLAHLGLESMDTAIATATLALQDLDVPVVAATGDGPRRQDPAAPLRGGGPLKPVIPMVLTLLGSAQNWLGMLDEAKVNLASAAELARRQGFGLTAAEALAHLALTEYMLGNGPAVTGAAEEALSLLDGLDADHRGYLRSAATLAARLARSVDVPWIGSGAGDEPEPVIHPGHLSHRFWLRIWNQRSVLSGGASAEVNRVPGTPAEPAVPHLPRHLQIAGSVEDGLLSVLGQDTERLGRAEARLRSLGATAKADLLAGLKADINGERSKAINLLRSASEDRTAMANVRALALAVQAQLVHSRGDREAALDLMSMAAAASAGHRDAIPFVGWSRHGSPVRTVLQELLQLSDPGVWYRPWLEQICAAVTTGAGVPPTFAHRTSSVPDSLSVPSGPPLSTREYDVLRLLARGATYDDISAELFLSRNTIKTHVSRLYVKLGASSRSEALATARSLYLI